MAIKIQIGDYEVLENGTIVSLPNLPVRFLIRDLIFELVFQENPTIFGQRITASQFPNRKGISILLTNFNNNNGSGNGEPIRLGTLDGKGLYLNFRIHALTTDLLSTAAGKTIHYTWLLKKENNTNG